MVRYLGAPVVVALAGFTGTLMPAGGYLGTATSPKPPTAQVARSTRESWDGDISDSGFQQYTPASVPNDAHRHSHLIALAHAAKQVFDRATIAFDNHTDPDEGWRRGVLVVTTGIEDLDKRLDAEDQFYAVVDADQILRDALRFTVVVFS